MKIETKVISTETIKPSSPTPKSLQKHQLSFLDQLVPPVFIPVIYFYAPNPEFPNSQKSDNLKKSLSETLTRFYPLAGRLVDHLYVDCNDSGVLFVEVEANCNISQFLTNPNSKEASNFFPHDYVNFQGFIMAVQATYFRGGGLAVSLLISHKIGDASSFILFVNTWSSVARDGDDGGMPLPKFNAAAHFPPRDIMPNAGFIMTEEITTGIFTFPAAKIAFLRETYSTAALRPTRVEAVSAFIWTRFLSACTGMKVDPNKTLTLHYPVNLRSRVEPPLSEYHFGNVYAVSTAMPAVEDGGAELILKARESMKGVDGGEKQLNFMKKMKAKAMKGELLSFSFTSLCGFSLYEADFGWGKPVRIGSVGFPMKNLAVLTDAKSGGGEMEVLIQLSKQDMKKFEADPEMSVMKSNVN